MAVNIRLARRGRKGLPFFSIVVATDNAPSQGKFIEKIGTYAPKEQPSAVQLNTARALYWLLQGAQPSPTARTILSKKGVMLLWHLQRGVARNKITQKVADERFQAWQTLHSNKQTPSSAKK